MHIRCVFGRIQVGRITQSGSDKKSGIKWNVNNRTTFTDQNGLLKQPNLAKTSHTSCSIWKDKRHPQQDFGSNGACRTFLSGKQPQDIWRERLLIDDDEKPRRDSHQSVITFASITCLTHSPRATPGKVNQFSGPRSTWNEQTELDLYLKEISSRWQNRCFYG